MNIIWIRLSTKGLCHNRKQGPPLNVVVFGETGAGKSSIINMLDGDEQAEVSSAATGVTSRNTCYVKTIQDRTFHVYDTAGLNEGTVGQVSARDAIEGLYSLICDLAGGVNLLVFVMRAPRITIVAQQNYRMLYDIICNKKVPIVIVITGLEHEQDPDKWWFTHKGSFDSQDMLFSGHACITATEGVLKGKAIFGEAYSDSRKKVAGLIVESFTTKPWKMQEVSWFSATVAQVLDILGIKSSDFNPQLYELLKTYGGLTQKEAMKLTKKMPTQKWNGRFPFFT